MHPAGPTAWSPPGAFWSEQNSQLRAMLLKRDEELRQLQTMLMKQNAELLALKEQQEQMGPPRDQNEGSAAPNVRLSPESHCERTRTDSITVDGLVDPNRQQLLEQLASLQTHTQMIQEEVNQLRTMVHLRKSPSKSAARVQRSPFRDASAAVDPHTPNSHPSVSPAAHSHLWLEFLQWMRAHGIQDLDQLRGFIVAHAGKRFLRDLANDICDAEDLVPETPDGINTPDRRYSLLSSITDIPISDPRPLSDREAEAEHPPALSWDMAEYEVMSMTSTVRHTSPMQPQHSSPRSVVESAAPPAPFVPPLPIHVAQQLSRVRSPTKGRSPRKKALSARSYTKTGDIPRSRSFNKQQEANGGAARISPRGRNLVAPVSARDTWGAHLNVGISTVGYKRRSASTVAATANNRGGLAERAPRGTQSPRKLSRTSQTSVMTPRPTPGPSRSAAAGSKQ